MKLKRIIATGLILCLLFTQGVLGLNVAAEESADTVVLGDVDGDTSVSMKDVLLLRRYIAKMLTTIDMTAADVNTDNSVDMRDVLLMRKYVAGIIRSFTEKLTGWQHELTSEFVTFRAGYDQLTDGEKAAYTEMITAIEKNMEIDTTGTSGSPGLVVSLSQPLADDRSVTRVFRSLYADQPEYYFLDSAFSYSRTQSGAVMSVTLMYTMNLAQRQQATPALIAAVDTVLGKLGSGKSTFEKELFIHDWLCSTCEMPEGDFDNNAFSPYGALVQKCAVSDGYSRGFQLLCLAANMPVTVVEGFSESGAAHMWNMIYFGNDPYFVDVGWDDGDIISHAYFNTTTADLAGSHTMNFDFPVPPTCTATAFNYFFYTGRYVTSSDTKAYADIVLKEYQNGAASVEVRFAPNVLAINKDRVTGGDLCTVLNTNLKPGQRMIVGYIYTFYDSMNVISLKF